MAVLEQIRVKFGIAASIIIALGLLSFILDPSEIVSAVNNMSSKNDVGNINGKAISYVDFQATLDNYTKINELMTGTTARTEQQQQQINNAAWQSLIDKYLFIKNARAAGINVGEDEMLALTTGDMISPVLSQDGTFADGNGVFSKEKLVDFVQQIPGDQTGNLKTYWDFVQGNVYTQEFYAKYGSMFDNGNYQNPLMLRKSIEENNNTADVDFIMIPAGYMPDSTVVVSSEEIKSYYNSHKNLFRQQASRDMEYVVFEVQPSAADVAATRTLVLDQYDEFATTDNLKGFLLRNSDRSYSEYWYRNGELNTIDPQINDFVFGGSGNVSEVITSGNTFYVARVMDSAMVPDSAYVRHILLSGDNASHQADSLLQVLSKGGKFSQLVADHSLDQGSSADGEPGNLGWMTQTYIIPGFESIFTAQTGKPYVLRTQYGTHIVEVTKKTAPLAKKQVAILEKTALASNETFNSYYAQANRFANIASGRGGYKAAVDSLGVYSHPMNKILESTTQYGGIESAKEVTRWVFDNKPGKVSPIITVNNKYFFVATVNDIHKEGTATVSEVAPVIREQLYAEKATAKKAEEIAAEIAGMTDLEEIADKLNATVSNYPSVAFSSLRTQGLDPKFIGAVSQSPVGEVCGPVAGSIGVYVYKVKSRDTGAYFTEDDARNMAQQVNSYNEQMILPVMMLNADVKDNRARFF